MHNHIGQLRIFIQVNQVRNGLPLLLLFILSAIRYFTARHLNLLRQTVKTSSNDNETFFNNIQGNIRKCFKAESTSIKEIDPNYVTKIIAERPSLTVHELQ